MSCRGTVNAVRNFFSEAFKRHTEDDAEQVVIVGAIGTIPDPNTLTSECPRPWLYTRVLAFFLLTTALLFVANVLTNPGQFSNVLVIGAFAVPFTVLVFFFEFNVFRNISFYTIIKALFIGGALSLIATAILPSFWFQGITSVSDAFVAGVGEEVAKLLVVYWILKRNRAYPYILNGLLIGAAVGAGFAIFETAGYGMAYFLGGDNTWIGKESMFVLALRNCLAPGGHVVWAAISGAGLLLAARHEPLSAVMLRRRPLWAAFLVSVVLHVLWDLPFFDSEWWRVGWMLVLIIVAWCVVAWLLRRGLEEVDTMRTVTPHHCECAFVSLPIAGPWRRWAARLLDAVCYYVIVLVATNKVDEYFGIGLIENIDDTVLAVAALPFLLFFEVIIYELFGATLGKWLFSLRVCDSNGLGVSSKIYFKRLLRLWVSGLGLWLPVVSFITSVFQYHRLSSRGQTSYDKALGLSVVNDRIHPLRWLLALPILLAVGLIVIAGMVGDDENGNTSEMPKSGNKRIEKVISSSGLNYELTNDGAYVIRFRLSNSDGRSQSCWIPTEVVAAFGTGCIRIYSIVAPYDSVDKLVLEKMLSENAMRYNNLWCKIGNHLFLRTLVSLEISPKEFRNAMEALVKDADAAENKLTGKDEF